MREPIAYAISIETHTGRRYFVRHSRGGCQSAWSIAGAKLWPRNNAEFLDQHNALALENRKPKIVKLYLDPF